MTFLMRKCALTARNVNRFRKLYALVNIESHRFFSIDTNNSKSYITGVHQTSSQFHTSQPSNGIVAFKLSDIGEGIREVVIKEWFVKVGDNVQQFDNICEVQSDKAAVTITSRYDGVVKRLHYAVDQTALVGNPLVDIEVDNVSEEDASSESSAEISAKPTPSKTSSSQRVKVLTTPAVRRIAAQFDVDLSTVKATGRNGRVLKEDVLSHLNISADRSNEISDASTVIAAAIPILQAHAKTELLLEDSIVPISGFTRAMVKSMTEAMKIPHFGLSDEYEVTKLVETRESLKKLAQEKGIKLTYMPIILKAASLSLSSFPILNSSLDNSCEHLIYKASHNIGVAMDTPNGLVVPVIKNVQNKSILEIARELNNLQEKGRNGQLGLGDLSGGTFSISNIGNIGGTYTSPIILPPQVAIGALGKIQVLPRFNSNGEVVKSHVLTVSWSADHRVIDGVTITRFSNHLKRYLENPSTLLLDL
ncbi:lipoamide acyltransferase component of branched-chain alpha-keto acid dehydrogenase complex, mitochondrial [Plodia interpunctella]|uniref:lipoamide acyltransferase component of branched-chain alpha-keto acid dehydrogenase complex, mitochondrial n=1 Tax=Plodia interpunctella TaxID=58824 RepID=UPI002367422C|nr:lipoamide acyltransferase component of branched-chain alpha-keto acid dehydrogenase complex, mitochondrial [Plodia interpunctella]